MESSYIWSVFTIHSIQPYFAQNKPYSLQQILTNQFEGQSAPDEFTPTSANMAKHKLTLGFNRYIAVIAGDPEN